MREKKGKTSHKTKTDYATIIIFFSLQTRLFALIFKTYHLQTALM